MFKRLCLFLVMALSAVCCAQETTPTERLVFAGPPEGILSLPVLRMIETTSGSGVEFVEWKTPDQLRSLISSRRADVVACHVNVAANFANRGADVRLLNVTLWKLFWLVGTADNASLTSAGLLGLQVGVPLKGDLPDVLISTLKKKLNNGMTLMYAPSSVSLAHWLLGGKTNLAMLPEPVASSLLVKSHKANGSMRRSLDVQQLWSEAFGGPSRLPFAGIAAVGDRVSDARLRQFVSDYADAARWCRENPHEAALLPSRHMPTTALDIDALGQSLGIAPPQPERAADCRREIEDYLRVIENENPNLIGNKLPDATFYF